MAIKRHTSLRRHWDICYYVKQRTYEIFLKKVYILFTPTREHMQNSEHMKY